ncbi:MAG: 1-deoxy-D-xylulose-5-phosphate synthase [Planctomycetota bacterium JB042]
MSLPADAPFPRGDARTNDADETTNPATTARKAGPLLPGIRSHADLVALERGQLPELAEEIRRTMADTVCTTGGHLGSNFGVVELTIALHSVFDFAVDRLVIDVGHQCYPHKLLTGRLPRFHSLRSKEGVSGYPHPGESPTDVMRSGHAGTSISMGLGIVAGDALLQRDRKVVCLIGDSSLGAGVALEGLTYADHLGKDILVVLNDNEMSISKTVGSLASYLNRLRAAPIYTGAKERFHALLRSVPFGEQLDKNLVDMVDAVKAAIAPGHLFEELGFGYYGPVDGHDIDGMIEELERLKKVGGVKLLHVITKKGKGLEATGKDTRFLHALSPGATLPGYNSPDGMASKAEADQQKAKPSKVSFTKAFSNAMLRAAERDPRVVAITAAMPDGTGLSEFAARFPERFHDTGITEQHAVALAGGLSKAGAKPVAAIYSTFLQRGYDQVFHEAILQDQPVVFALDRGGLVGQDGPSHNGVFDIAYLRTFPAAVVCSPRDASELEAMLNLGLEQEHPFFMRYPRGTCADPELPAAPLEVGKGELLRKGTDATLVGLGPMAYLAMEAAARLAEEGIDVAVVNPRFVKPLDVELLSTCAAETGLLVTIEEHQVMGGFGSAVLEALALRGEHAEKVLPLGIPDRLIEHAARPECLDDAGLTLDHVVRAVRERVRRS